MLLECRKGFTLMEVVVVLAIVAIVAAFSIPALTTWRTNALYQEEARVFLGAMFKAKSLAVSSNLQSQLEFDIGNNRYRLTQGDRAENSNNFDTVITDWVDVPAAIALRSTSACNSTADLDLQFNPNGTSKVGYICVLDPQDLTTAKYKVGVASDVVGRPTIEK